MTAVARPVCDDFNEDPEWLPARRALLEQCLEQGCVPAEGSLEQAARTPKHRPLALRCARHDVFSLLLRDIKDSLSEGLCPGCRLERLTGLSMPSNDVIAAIKRTPVASTVVRAARAAPLASPNAPVRKHRAVSPDGTPRRGLAAQQARLDARFGAGVLSLGTARYEGERASRKVLCLKNPDHGSWVTSPRSLHRLAGSDPCPRCRQEQFAKDAPVPCSVRRPGGYLYRIIDRASELRYIGLTTVTPEQRFQGHREAAERGVAHPLYAAMRSRPEDFTVLPLAYYWDVCDLQEAEKAAIADEGTRWPRGYNLTEGGEYGSRQTPLKRLQKVIDVAYPDEPAREPVLQAAYQLYLNGTRLEHLYALLRKQVSVKTLEDRLAGRVGVGNKIASIEVRGELYTEGLVATCKAHRLCTKAVRRLMRLDELTAGQAIERLLDNREATPAPTVFIDGVGYSSLIEAQRALKVSYPRLKKMAQAGRSDAAPVVVQRSTFSTAQRAQELGLPREFYRNARKKGLLDSDILRLGQNLRVLSGTAQTPEVVVEGVTYDSLDAMRTTLGLSRSLTRALAYGTLTVAQARARMSAPRPEPSKDAASLAVRQRLVARARVASKAREHKAWLQFQADAQAFFESHGHLRITRTSVGAAKGLVSRIERLRAQYKQNALSAEQVQWLAERGYIFDALAEQTTQRDKWLEMARRRFAPGAPGTPPVPLTEAEERELSAKLRRWMKSLMTGDLGQAVREVLVELQVDWRFAALVFEEDEFSGWASAVARALQSGSPLDERQAVWLSFVRQTLRRKRLPAACQAVLARHPAIGQALAVGATH